jgi:hypothetical protein
MHARTLNGVNSKQIIAVGASIGADAAAAGCAAVLKNDPDACLGTLSISPGNYLSAEYAVDIALLAEVDPPRPARCLYGEDDPDADVCRSITRANFFAQGWSGGYLHGMHLLTPHLDPNPLEVILDFFDLALNYSY